MRNKRAMCQFAGKVALRSQNRALIETHVTDTRVRGNQVFNGDSPVIQNDEFAVRIVLAQEVVDGLRDIPAPIVRRHDATYERCCSITNCRVGGGRSRRTMKLLPYDDRRS